MSLNSDLLLLLAADDGAYEIEQSLRFNVADGHYLNRTPSTDGNRRTFTYSGWHKFVGMPDASNNRRIFGARSANTDSGWFSFHMRPDTDNRLEIQLWNHSVNVDNRIRDFSAWYHLVLAVDTTQATATDRVKVYINGVQATYTNNSGSGISGFTQNLDLAVNDNASNHNIGSFNSSTASTDIMPMYAAEIYFVDGTQLDATSFGEFDDNGVWRPISVSGLTYGTNGFHLDFSNSSNLGEDQAGSNDWTANNFTTSGTGTDVMSDTPTTNWCTLNPLSLRASYNNDCNDGNLGIEAVGGNWDRGTKGTIGASSGKWYWEYTHGTIASGYPQADIGVTKYENEINHYSRGGSGSADTWLIQGNNGNKYHNGSGSSYGSSFTTGDTCNIALDLDNGKVWFGKNGTWFNSGDPAAGTNEAFSGLSGTFWPLFYWGISAGTSGLNQAYFNFGQRAFEYTVPTGFLALNTSNLPAPDIAKGSKYFNAVLWTGNATARNITTGHNSNLTWIKHRSTNENHNLYDILRGVGNRLETNSQDYEVNYADRLTAFNSDGFSLGTGYNNTNTTTYVGWSWAGGGSGSSISTGSIDGTNPTIASTVSANPTAGFSIVTYSGSATDDTVAHGLGAAPSLIIFKRYNNNGTSWPVYHSNVGPGDLVQLNENAAKAASGNSFGSTPTAPTSTYFSVGDNGGTNYGNMVAYCFAEIEGYSKFGVIKGTYIADGPFIYLGFTPAFLMFKNAERASTDWTLIDATRDPYNYAGRALRPNQNLSEDTYTERLDILSNGFKIRTADLNYNGPDDAPGIVYAAFASNPFGGDGVTPATAR